MIVASREGYGALQSLLKNGVGTTLEDRKRYDVIEALKKHEIGYHSNTHSMQPTIAVYLQNAGWEDGSAEFLRREWRGAQDITRIFGVTPKQATAGKP